MRLNETMDIYRTGMAHSHRLPALHVVIAIHMAVFLGLVYSSAGRELLPYEPVQYLKAQLPPSQSTPFTNFIGEAMPTEAAEFITKAKTLLKSHLAKSGTSVVLLKGERVMVQRRTKGLQWDSKIELPYSNALSLVSVVLPILLENYRANTIRDPIGQVLKGNDRTHPLVTGRESMSFLDILNKLPVSGKTLNLDSPLLLRSLLANGELSFYFVNTILGKSAHEAWMDALMAIGSTDITQEENGQLVMDLNSLLQFSLTVIHDLKMIGAALKKERLPLDKDKYLFGWWFNCPKDSSSNCLVPSAPSDTIFTLSPDLRLFITPSLELTLIIVGPGATAATRGVNYQASKNLKSIADILIEDAEIWKLFNSSVAEIEDDSIAESEAPSDASNHNAQQEGKDTTGEAFHDTDEVAIEEADEVEPTKIVDNENADLIELVHWIWPVIVFMFWVTASHVCVYCMLNIFWYLRAHISRSKTAA